MIYWLTEELVALGHDVTLFASGDSHTSANLVPVWPKALRLDGEVRDACALHYDDAGAGAAGVRQISIFCTPGRGDRRAHHEPCLVREQSLTKPLDR